jgi:hypothetical protein
MQVCYISIDYAFVIQKNAIVIYPSNLINFKNSTLQQYFNIQQDKQKIILTPGKNLIKLYNSHSKLFALIKLYAVIFNSLKFTEISSIALILENSYYKKYLSTYAKLFAVREIILELFNLCLDKHSSIEKKIYYVNKKNISKLNSVSLTKSKKYIKSQHIIDALNFLEYYLNKHKS